MNRVVTTPEVQLRCDGHGLSRGLAASLTRVEVQQAASASTRCRISFMAPPADVQALRLGAALVLSLAGQGNTLFDGRITAVEHEYLGEGLHHVHVVAHDALHALSLRQTRRALIDLSTAAVVQALVNDLGIEVVASSPGPRWYRVLQFEQTDLALLVHMTRRSGHYFHLRAGRLQVFTLGDTPSPVVLKLGADVLQARFEHTADAPGQMRAHTWNPWRGAAIQGSARAARAAAAGSPTARRLVNTTAQSVEQADADAQATLDRLIAAAQTLQGLAEGNARLHPGCRVRIEGTHNPSDYLLTHVTHTVDPDHGYLTRFDSTVPPAPVQAHGSMLTLGHVSRVDDPEGLGRVRVLLSCFDELESDWLEVVLPAAGPDRGLVALPTRDDQVLVLLEGGDAAQGVVLGGLWGETRPADAGVVGNDVRRMSFRSPSGHCIVLDDEARSLRVEHGNGSFMQLTDHMLTVHAASAMTLEAPGQRLVLRAAAIDFEQG